MHMHCDHFLTFPKNPKSWYSYDDNAAPCYMKQTVIGRKTQTPITFQYLSCIQTMMRMFIVFGHGIEIRNNIKMKQRMRVKQRILNQTLSYISYMQSRICRILLYLIRLVAAVQQNNPRTSASQCGWVCEWVYVCPSAVISRNR